MKNSKRKQKFLVLLNQFSFHFVRLIISPFLSLLFHYSCDSFSDIKGPYLLLCNHNMNIDPIWVGSAAGHHIYYIATDHVLHAGFKSKLLMFFLNPIMITKGKIAPSTVMECMKRLKNGHSICIFPEGNRSFSGITGSISPGTAKLALRCGVPLITFRLEGGYLTHPRWSLAPRHGKVHGKLVHVYSREELASMSDTALQKAIESDLYENAWETQEKQLIRYRSKAPALGLEAALYVCPQCRSLASLKSDSASVTCRCGFSASFSLLGELSLPQSAPFRDHTVAGWMNWQKNVLSEFVGTVAADVPVFSDSVTSRIFGQEQEASSPCSASLIGYRDRIEIVISDRHLTVTGGDSEGISIFSRNTLTFLLSSGARLDISGNQDFCGLKYIDLYTIIKNGR